MTVLLRGALRWLRQTYRRTPEAIIGGGIVFLVCAFALLAPIITSTHPMELGSATLQPPSNEHILGTDSLGRDVATRLLYGSRLSLIVGVFAALSASVIGVAIGALAGGLGRNIDRVLMRITEIFQSIPTFVFAAVVVAVLKSGTVEEVVVIGLLAWPQVARVMRGEVLRVKGLVFVDAVRCQGVGEGGVLFRHVLPNSLAAVIPVGALVVAEAVLLQAGLAFLGLGSTDDISWGLMLNEGQHFLSLGAWWLSAPAGLAILITVVGFNLFADGVSTLTDPSTNGSEH